MYFPREGALSGTLLPQQLTPPLDFVAQAKSSATEILLKVPSGGLGILDDPPQQLIAPFKLIPQE
jgi:hypothetical protein